MSRPIVLVVREPGSHDLTFSFDGNELKLGTGPDADLRLRHPSVSEQLDARIRREKEREGELVLTSYRSAASLKVNGLGVSMRAIVHGDVIQIGEVEIAVVYETKLDPREQALVDDIIANPTDETLRIVYADWLEENGFADRAEYLRLESALDTALKGAWKLSVRDDIAYVTGLARKLPPGWLALVRRRRK